MKTVLILGDGWGDVDPGLYDHDGGRLRDDIVHLLDFNLTFQGHTVVNLAKSGSRNLHQLKLAETYFKMYQQHQKHVDLVVWFHTELVRDWWRSDPKQVAEMKTLGLDLYLDKMATVTYKAALDLKKFSPTTKWVIVGGHCAIRNTQKFLLEWADLIIDNWRQDLSGKECPECHTLEFINEFEVFRECFTDEIIERENLKRKQIREVYENTELFWNKAHPSPKCYRDLGEKILSILENDSTPTQQN